MMMRIYEIVTEYTRGKDRFTVHDRFRVACDTFAEALRVAEAKIHSKAVAIASIEIIADTRM
jgi:hypothetical protein